MDTLSHLMIFKNLAMLLIVDHIHWLLNLMKKKDGILMMNLENTFGLFMELLFLQL